MNIDTGKSLFASKTVYYGWIMAVGLAFMNFTTVSLLTVNMGLFIGPMSDSLGISQSWFGWAQTARLAGAALSGFIIGRLLDVKSARVPLMVISLVVFILFLSLSHITSAWQLIIAFLITGMLGLAPSAGNLFTVVPISRWFLKKRGKALSIAFMGFPVGLFFLAPFTQFLINSIGWRSTLMAIGIAGGVILFIVAILLKSCPEDYGLEPDGVYHKQTVPEVSEQDTPLFQLDSKEISWTKSEAVHTKTFWKLTIATALIMFANSTLAVFRIPYFVSLGIDPMVISYSLSLEAVVSVIITLFLGSFISRIKVNYLMALSPLTLAIHLLASIFTTQIWHVFLAQAFMGISIQSRFVLEGVIWPNYFGKQFIGNIRGLTVPLYLTFSFLGAPFTGLMYDTFNSYVPAWWVLCGILMLSAILFASTPKPKYPCSK